MDGDVLSMNENEARSFRAEVPALFHVTSDRQRAAVRGSGEGKRNGDRQVIVVLAATNKWGLIDRYCRRLIATGFHFNLPRSLLFSPYLSYYYQLCCLAQTKRSLSARSVSQRNPFERHICYLSGNYLHTE